LLLTLMRDAPRRLEVLPNGAFSSCRDGTCPPGFLKDHGVHPNGAIPNSSPQATSKFLTPQYLACYKAATTISSGFMRCPKCGCQDDKVVDSRASREGATIRRRRECTACGHRFTTYEEVERGGLMILKRDGRREEFSKEKLLSGIRKACQKRPISPKAIEDLVEQIAETVSNKFEVEVPAEFIGKQVMDGLREIDEVAYVRFASVYRRFQEATDFVHEVKKLEAKQ
jgi:transcriptional repressor NrdR